MPPFPPVQPNCEDVFTTEEPNSILYLLGPLCYTPLAMAEYIQVLTTTERREDAERIAQSLVQERLAACVQIVGPIQSTYRWQGAIETAQEWQCLAKTRRDLYAEVEQAIRQLHPYEVPEILALPVLDGSASYLAWLEGELRPDQGRGNEGN